MLDYVRIINFILILIIIIIIKPPKCSISRPGGHRHPLHPLASPMQRRETPNQVFFLFSGD